MSTEFRNHGGRCDWGITAEGAGEIGFLRGEIDKETIEDLVTSNIQPKPGPELFHVTEVPYGDDGRIVFIIEVAVGFGDVWQARDKDITSGSITKPSQWSTTK